MSKPPTSSPNSKEPSKPSVSYTTYIVKYEEPVNCRSVRGKAPEISPYTTQVHAFTEPKLTDQ